MIMAAHRLSVSAPLCVYVCECVSVDVCVIHSSIWAFLALMFVDWMQLPLGVWPSL